MNSAIEDVVRQFDRMVQSDGSKLALVSDDDGVVRLLYQRADISACETCVLSPEDLQALVLEALERNKLPVTRVQIDQTACE